LALLSACATPAFAQVLGYSAKNTLVTITVDGNLNESAWSTVITEDISETVNGTPSITATFGALWTSTHLYVGIKVLDSQLFNDTANTGTPPTNVWQDDSVEVYIDGNYNHATTYELTGGANGLGNDRQFIKGYNDPALGGKGSQTGVLHAWAAITGGYTIEMAIPWSNINVTGAAAGLTIGFDVGVNDDDNGGITREAQVMWNGTNTNFNNTEDFGDLTLSATTVGDTTPPTVAITAPTGGTVNGSIAVSATASDNVGVVGVQFRLDGVNVGAEDTSSPYSVTWDTTTATEGSHTLTAVARDAADNFSTSSGISVTVNNSYSAKNTLAAVTVDGNLSESVWTTELTGSVLKLVVGVSQNNTVTFGALWDATHLYVGVKVLDGNLFNDTTGASVTWKDDSVEVYIDANHNHGTAYDGFDRQFMKGYLSSEFFSNQSTTGVLHGTQAIAGGYTIELAIPWGNLGVTGAAGLTIGFDVGNNDDDNGGTTRENQLMWHGTNTNYNNTSAFGDLTLSATTIGSGGAPEINVTGAGLNIVAGDTSPQTADGTNFGSADIATGTVQKVFNIQNTGSATLTLGNVTTTNSEFGVLTQPAPSIAAGGNSNFEIAFIPTATGLRTATLSFTNNDANEDPYNFAVQGTGTGSSVSFAGSNTQVGKPGGNPPRLTVQAEVLASTKRLVRNGVKWNLFEKTTGNYTWDDPFFLEAEAFFQWCKDQTPQVSIIMGVERHNSLYNLVAPDAAGAAARQALANAHGALAARWQSRGYPIIGWEVMNEFTSYPVPYNVSQQRANEYADLCVKVSAAVKAALPAMKIHWPSSTSVSMSSDFRNKLKTAIAGNESSFDILDIHGYFKPEWVGNGYTQNLAGFKQLITDVRSLWPNKDVTVGEIGWISSCSQIGNPCTTEADQATKLDTVFRGIMDDPNFNYVKHMVWFSLFDKVPADNNYGLIREDNVSKKPAWTAFKNLPLN
ncbi:MAG: sugar-binding protein, partial [Opitutaceae bacterium]